MITTILNSIELPAIDLAATKAFYEETLGWTFVDYGPTYVAAQVSGIEVGFNAEATVSTSQRNGDENPTGPLLLLQTDDLDAAHAAVAGDGGVIVTSPFDFPGGSRFHFRDPSGNVLAVYRADQP